MAQIDPTIYLASPISDGQNPYKWHEEIQSECPSIEWINPFTIHEEGATGAQIYETDMEAVATSDAVLLRRTEGCEICGAYIEAGYARSLEIPTVVFNDAQSDVPEFLQWHAVSIHDNRDKAIRKVADLVR